MPPTYTVMPTQTSPTLREWLSEKPFAITLSAGFFGFFAHAGVMTVLEDAGLLPIRVSGASAGALVGGIWASGANATTIRDELLRLRRDDFWDMRPGLGLLAGRLFQSRVESLLPASVFEECRVPASLSVYDVLSRSTRVVDRGPLAPAIVASCAVPGLFHPVWLGGRPLLDGGILDRHGLAGMPSDTRVFYHHLASRSPWRRRGSASLEVPNRPDMTALVIDTLPRVGPFRLERGMRAFDIGAQAAKEALDKPITGGIVRVRGMDM
jgi:NTE family protein